MEEKTYIIEFENISVADANRYAEELRQELLDANDDIKVERTKSDALTQDFGSTLVLILSTPAAIAAIRAIQNYLQRKHNASITISEKKNGEKKVVAKNLTGEQAVKVAQIFKK